MRLLVCGGRNFTNAAFIYAVLNAVKQKTDIDLLMHGACHLGGADIMAGQWANAVGVPVEAFPIDPLLDGKWPSCGPRRNLRMLTVGKPTHVIAFPGGRGTRNTVKLARQHVGADKVWEPKP